MTGGAEVQRFRLTCARGDTSAGNVVQVDDSNPTVGEMDSRAVGEQEWGRGGRLERWAVLSPFIGDLSEVDQPC